MIDKQRDKGLTTKEEHEKMISKLKKVQELNESKEKDKGLWRPTG